MKRIVVAVGILAVAAVVGYLLRGQLVKVLTKTTGTWVGTPKPPEPAAA